VNILKDKNMKRVVFLVSAGGGTMKFIYSRREELDIDIIGVIGDRECKALEYARGAGINCDVMDFDNQQELTARLAHLNPDVVVTTVWRILKPEVLQLPIEFVNVHYSLLPAHRGVIGTKYLHESRKKGEKYTGATLHRVNEDVDSGEILAQMVFRNTEYCIETIFEAGCLLLGQWFIGVTNEDYWLRLNNQMVLSSTVINIKYKK